MVRPESREQNKCRWRNSRGLRAIGALTAAALCLSLSACGGGGGHHIEHDRDNDNDHNDDDAQIVGYGHAADPAERAAVTTLVKHYYSDAAAGDGASACALLATRIREAIVEEDGGSARLHGSTCPVVIAKLFAVNHHELAEKSAALQIAGVRVREGKGVVLLEFPELREVRQMSIRHIGGAWKLHDLRDRFIE